MESGCTLPLGSCGSAGSVCPCLWRRRSECILCSGTETHTKRQSEQSFRNSHSFQTQTRREHTFRLFGTSCFVYNHPGIFHFSMFLHVKAPEKINWKEVIYNCITLHNEPVEDTLSEQSVKISPCSALIPLRASVNKVYSCFFWGKRQSVRCNLAWQKPELWGALVLTDAPFHVRGSVVHRVEYNWTPGGQSGLSSTLAVGFLI